jgi:hypothetical protein
MDENWLDCSNFRHIILTWYKEQYKTKKLENKTENHFSPYPRSEGDINLYTRIKVAMSC